MTKKIRTEIEVFQDLVSVASEKGYVHAVAALCFRDNTMGYSGSITADDLLSRHTSSRLIRTEISTLIGAMLRSPIDSTLPDPWEIQSMMDRTEALLSELHECLLVPMKAAFGTRAAAIDPFSSGPVLREPVFYGAESAYDFQYVEFTPPKYQPDNEWISANKGFNIEDAVRVAVCIGSYQNEKLNKTLDRLKDIDPSQWTMLPAYIFTSREIADVSGLEEKVVETVIEAFLIPDGSVRENFLSVGDFNGINAYPIIRLDDGSLLLFQYYALLEAIYESPFYWMVADKRYLNKATENRGEFTERFSADKLSKVFGDNRVFKNINITKDKRNILGEIDVMVRFSDRIIVLQAKSKKMTIESRRGNDLMMKEDFRKAIQNSYDQAWLCSTLLLDDGSILINSDGNEIKKPSKIKKIYIMCVVSEHYPALSFQSRQFLSTNSSDAISNPYVGDIFLLDALAEMLESPLQFLSYLERRTGYNDRVLSSHELAVLSFHLKNNLWFDDEADLVSLGDDVSVDLDVAMMVRRRGVPGRATPDGVLTRTRNTVIGRLVEQIEKREDPLSVDLGFLLLTLSENTIREISRGIVSIVKMTRADKGYHDISVGIADDTGITIHSGYESDEVAFGRLRAHCERRKCLGKASSWFGLFLQPGTVIPKFGIKIDYPWVESKQFENAIGQAVPTRRPRILAQNGRGLRKIGRNEPCYCGSGKKYKVCCLTKETQ